MTLPASGAISIGDIATEFGITKANVSFSSLYRANGYTSGAVAANGIANISSNFSISQSGQIELGQFYNAQKGFKYVANISSDTANYVLSDVANTAGWDGIIPIDATVIIDSSKFVYSTSTSTAAFRITPSGNYLGGATNSRFRLVNNGFISGKGGAGGSGGQGGGSSSVSSEPGGAGFSATGQYSIIDVNNLGTIAGGGGGGGGGQSGRGTDGGEGTAGYGAGGGGGGAGYSGGAGGGGVGDNYSGSSGAAGSWNAGGGGGGGGSGNGVSAGSGGGGGTAGNAGGTGGNASGLNSLNGPWGGASGGPATYGSSNITWVNTGSRLGAVS